MMVTMAMNDTGKDGDGELYLSVSEGGKWLPAVNVTNNSGRTMSKGRTIGTHSAVATYSYLLPGPAAVAVNKTGDLIVVHVSKEYSLFGGSSFGVQTFGGSTSKPTLFFVGL